MATITRRAATNVAKENDSVRPGKLAQALGITGKLNGADLVTVDRGVWVADDGVPPPAKPAMTPRVGISKGREHPWRWHVLGNPYVSRAPRLPPANLTP